MSKQKDKLPLKLECSSHRDEKLLPMRNGWFCESCGKIAVDYSRWPGPKEKLSEDLDLTQLPTFLSAKIADADDEDHELIRL